MELGGLLVDIGISSRFRGFYLKTSLGELEEWWDLNSEIRVLWLEESEDVIDWREKRHHVHVIAIHSPSLEHDVDFDGSLLDYVGRCMSLYVVGDVSESLELN